MVAIARRVRRRRRSLVIESAGPTSGAAHPSSVRSAASIASTSVAELDDRALGIGPAGDRRQPPSADRGRASLRRGSLHGSPGSTSTHGADELPARRRAHTPPASSAASSRGPRVAEPSSRDPDGRVPRRSAARRRRGSRARPGWRRLAGRRIRSARTPPRVRLYASTPAVERRPTRARRAAGRRRRNGVDEPRVEAGVNGGSAHELGHNVGSRAGGSGAAPACARIAAPVTHCGHRLGERALDDALRRRRRARAHAPDRDVLPELRDVLGRDRERPVLVPARALAVRDDMRIARSGTAPGRSAGPRC